MLAVVRRRRRADTRWIVALATLVCASGSEAIVFDDGLTHVVDAANSYPFDSAEVRDSSGGAPTHLTLLSGGEIGTGEGFSGALAVFEHSGCEVSGGEVPRLYTYGDSTAEVSAGEIRGQVNARYSSTVRISGGSIGSGDRSESIYIKENARVEMSGGVNERSIQVFDAGEIGISGGTIGFGWSDGNLRLTDQASAVVSGGQFNPEFDFLVLQESTLTIVGEGFNYAFGEVTPLSGTLEGILADGSAISVTFGRASTARIVLAPEPGAESWAAALCSVMVLKWVRRTVHS